MTQAKTDSFRAPALNRTTTAGVQTPRSAAGEGGRWGKTWKFDPTHFPPFKSIEPSPPADDERLPAAVREYREAAAAEMAHLVREHARVRADLTSQVAADEQFLNTVNRERLAENSRTLSDRAYRILITLIGIGEFIIASLVFNVLGTALWESLIAGAVLGVIVSLSTHFLGKELKTKDRNLLVLGLAVLGAACAVFAIAALRGIWIQATGVVASMGLNTSPTAITLLFTLIQIAAVAAGTLCSYAHTRRDPVAELAQIEVSNAEQRLVRSRDRLASLRDEYRAKCAEVDRVWSGLAAAFAKGNMKARRKGGYYDQPRWIDHLQPLPIPEALDKTDEQELEAIAAAPADSSRVTPSIPATAV